MKAAILKDLGHFQIEEVEIPQPEDKEIRIRVQTAGVCGSDSSMFLGKLQVPLPVIPGHEAVGFVDALGSSVTSFHIGQRVTIHPNYFCGNCPMCLKGLTNICKEKVRLGVDINGVFAEFVVVPERALYPLPESLPDEVAVFAEPLSVAVHGVKQATPRREDRVLVFGAGVLGQLTMQLALMHCEQVTTCDLVPSRLALAKEMGAIETLGDQDALNTREGTYDVIYETSGAPSALAQAIHLAAPGGRIVVQGLPGQDHAISTVMIVRKELKIYGSMIYTDEFSESIELLEKGLIQTQPLVSCVSSLEGLQENLENFSSPHRMKTLVKVQQ